MSGEQAAGPSCPLSPVAFCPTAHFFSQVEELGAFRRAALHSLAFEGGLDGIFLSGERGLALWLSYFGSSPVSL